MYTFSPITKQMAAYKNNKIATVLVPLLWSVAFYAQADDITVDFLFQRAAIILNKSIVVLIGIAVLVFFWGIIQYVMAADDEKKLQTGRSYMVNGIIGLTVIVSLWGIVNLLVFTIFGQPGGGAFDFHIPSI